MSTSSKVDCHFFLNSTCLKGDKCQFRHSEGARQTTDICPAFKETGQCPEKDCGRRHTVEQIARTTKGPAEIPCRNEENGGVCTRSDCIFKHSRRANPPTIAGTRPPRPSSTTSSDSASNRLNAGAKAFVPIGKLGQQRPPVRPRPNMEWTPDSSSNKPQQTRPFGDKQWRPSASGGQEDFAARPSPMRPFANKEWTPASAAVSTNADSSSAGTNAFAKPSAFGNKAFTQNPFASKESAFSKTKPSNVMFSSGTGIMHRPQADMSPAAMSGITDTDKDKGQGDNSYNVNDIVDDDEGMDIDNSQSSSQQTKSQTQTQSQIQIRNQEQRQQQPPRPATSAFKFAASNKGAASFKPPNSTKSSIPSIFDILGIQEQKTASIERQRRVNPGQTMHPPISVQQPSSSDQADEANQARQSESIMTTTITSPIIEPNPISIPKKPIAYKCNAQQATLTASNAQKTDSLPPPPPPPVCDRSMNNSPLSSVCYASGFPDYMGIGFKPKVEAPPRPRTPEPMSISASASVSEGDVEADIDTDTSTDAEGYHDLSLNYTHKASNTLFPDAPVSKPFSKTFSNPVNDKKDDAAKGTGIIASTQLPKILSFQEIMERKRRKQAEAARLAKESDQPSNLIATSTPSVPSKSDSSGKSSSLNSTPAKRRVISDDSDDIDSDASEGKRVKPSLSSNSSAPPATKKPEVTNYVAMFEKELADMNLDLSGPLTNSPASDRISKANIKDFYFDADLANILSSKK